jgi:hypothetical protein
MLDMTILHLIGRKVKGGKKDLQTSSRRFPSSSSPSKSYNIILLICMTGTIVVSHQSVLLLNPPMPSGTRLHEK